MDKIPDVIVVAVASAIFIGGTLWSLAWWLSGKFSEIKALVYQQISRVELNILNKLEYHEKHDDTRFTDIQNNLWDIRVRNAAKDGLSPLTLNERK